METGERGTPMPATASERETPTPPTPPRVLLADDADRLRSLYRAVLETDGRFEVVAEAADGREAIDAAAEHQPDLILLDLSMPRLDGLEALGWIQQVAPSSQVIVLSGLQEDRYGDPTRERGAIGYIEKGGSPKDLIAEIETITEGTIDLADRPPADDDGASPPTPPPEPLREPVETVQDRIDEIVRRWPDETVDGPLDVALQEMETLRTRLEALARLHRTALSETTRDRVPLDDVVDAVQQRLDGALADATLRRGELPVVHADRDQVETAIAEIVENAATFGSASTIEIRAAETDDGWEIVVVDDGSGIPDTHLDQVVEPFETTGDPRQHPGLGLALAQTVALEHGGDLDIEDAPGGGTAVTLTVAEP